MAENTKKQDLATGAELTLEEKINKIKSREITEAEKNMLTLPAFEAACEAVNPTFWRELSKVEPVTGVKS